MTDIKVSDTEISKDITEISVGDVETVATQPPIAVEGYKKEFAIVGDALFATVDTGDVPEWLSTLLNSVVGTYVDDSLLGLQHLDAALQAAISQIDIAKNTYDEQINIQQTVENSIVSYLSTLNASMGDNTSNIVDIRNTYASKDYASSLIANHIDSSVNNGAIQAKLTEIRNTVTTLQQSLSQSINTLEANLTDTESGAIATADAVEKLYTYTGVDGQGSPTGTGLLADLQIVQKQQDGVIETYTGTYDVITYEDTAPADGVPDPDSITLVVTAEPYCNWTPLEGLGVPTSTDEEIRRVYKDTSNNKYYVFTSNGWLETTESEYLQDLDALRILHIGDTYIKYEIVGGERKYLGAYKFIRTIEDVTTPYGTDAEGFTWAKITDTDSQNAFMVAVQANDLADSKRRVFTVQPSGEQDTGDLWVSTDTADGTQIVRVFTGGHRAYGFNPSEWVIADEQLNRFVADVYTPESTSLKNQVDGKKEHIFVRTSIAGQHSLADGIAETLVEPYDHGSSNPVGITYLQNILSKTVLLERIAEVVAVTASVREAFHGSVVYFADVEPAEAYWYSSVVGTWRVIKDTSVYDALVAAENAQTSADGVIVSFYGYESNVSPNTFTGSAEFPVLQYWYDTTTTTLNTRVGSGWMPYTGAKPDDTLTVVVVDRVTTDNNGETVTTPYFAKIDTKTYTYNSPNWVSATPNGFIAESRKLLELDSFLQGPDGKYGSADSRLDIHTKTRADEAYLKASSKFAYDSSIKIPIENPISGNTEVHAIDSGFGINASMDNQGGIKNEFWINAETLKFTNTNKSGQATPFQIDTSGPAPEIAFNGKITFGGGRIGSIDEAISASVGSIVVGDRNVNISDNLIPITQFVTATNHAGYVFCGGFSKYKAATLGSYTEAIAKLKNPDSTLLSPFVDDMTESYYFRFGITGVTSLDDFSFVVFTAMDTAPSDPNDTDSSTTSDGVTTTITVNADGTTTTTEHIEVTLSYTTPETTIKPPLSPAEWYEVDGLITPFGSSSTGSHGYIRNKSREVVAEVENVVLSSDAKAVSLGWSKPCEISRIKLAVVTADTITSAAASEALVDLLRVDHQNQLQALDNSVNAITEDDILSAIEKRALIADVHKIQATREVLIGLDDVSGQAERLELVNSTPSSPYMKYKNAYNSLMVYLEGLTYADSTDNTLVHWNTTTKNTVIQSAQFNGVFDTYIAAEQALLAAINGNLQHRADYTASILGDPENSSGEVTIDKGFINADALSLGKDLVDIHIPPGNHNPTWNPKPHKSGVFLNNSSINVIVNGVTRVKIGDLSNTLPISGGFWE